MSVCLSVNVLVKQNLSRIRYALETLPEGYQISSIYFYSKLDLDAVDFQGQLRDPALSSSAVAYLKSIDISCTWLFFLVFFIQN